MSEQLWYTWSTSGFGTANGNRVRAASPELKDIDGPRVSSFIPLVKYTLPQYVDPFLPPEKAPLCLAFLKSEYQQESVLIQKTYTGLDGLKRPGVFFSHLLAELPPVPSPCIEEQVPFSAREAIALWKATWGAEKLWRDTELGWPEGKRDLAPIPFIDLYADMYIDSRTNKYTGPLNAPTLQIPNLLNQVLPRPDQRDRQIPDLFSLVMQAFLTLALSRERKRLYLLGDPDTVAALIWGITHALPRTLDIMRDLTFSTFESNVEAGTNPLIVGTCWLPQYRKQGRENDRLDVPEFYYQPNNPSGITIDCEPPYKHTPFQIEPLTKKYTDFVLDCYSQGSQSLRYLKTMLDAAERRNISQVPGLFNHYIPYQDNLPKEEVNRILHDLDENMVALITHASNALQQEKLPAAVAGAEQLLRLQLVAEDLQRESVLRSIIRLMGNEPDWWQTEGKTLISHLYQLSSWYSREQLTQLANTFLEKIAASKEWKKKQGEDLIPVVLPLVSAGATPAETLTALAQRIIDHVLEAQKALRQSLSPLACQITDQLVQVLRHDDYEGAVFWSNAFADCADSPHPPLDVWAYLLQQLSSLDSTPTYQKWWQQYGQGRLPAFRSRANAFPTSKLSSAFSIFAAASAPRLSAALQADNQMQATFWATILQAVAPVASEPAAWASFLQQLATLSYTTAYAQWWNIGGATTIKEILTTASKNPNGELDQALSAFILQVASSLVLALRNNQLVAYTFWKDLLASSAPYKSQPALWASLLLNLRELLTTSGFQQWWRDQGREATAYLGKLAATNTTVADTLSLFRQRVAEVVGNIITAEAQQGRLEGESMITFLFKVLTTATPAQDNQSALSLLQTLSQASLYQRISWERRAMLLQYWQQVAMLTGELPALLRPWLEVSWTDLGRLLALDLPDAWSKYAITRALEIPSSVPTQHLLEVVTRFSSLFEEVLVTLFALPQTQQLAMQFFSFLAQNHYSQTLPLLAKLAAASGYRLDVAEHLLRTVQPTDEREIATLLELHCQDWISSYDLPPTLLRLIEHYLTHFDVEYLDADPTRNLLQRLLQRAKGSTPVLPAHLQQTVEGWYQIAEFLASPLASHSALRDLSHSMRPMTKLAPDVQEKLRAKLLPHMIALVETDTDLTRVIDNLGRDTNNQMLQEMIRLAGEQYRQDHSLERLAPYVRTILAEARFLQSPEKEQFVGNCLRQLFVHVDPRTRDKFKNDALWPKAFSEEWKNVQNFLRSSDSGKSLNRFREAERKLFIPEIAASYDPLFASSISDDEQWLAEQAIAFVTAYNRGNDTEMLRIHDAIKRRYQQSLSYTQPQVDRIQSARQRLAQQQASSPQSSGNASFSGSSYAGNSPIWSEENAAGVGRAQTPPGSLAPVAQQQISSPATSASNQRYVATVKGQGITANQIDWAAMLIAPYLKWKRDGFARYVQTTEGTGSSEEKKELRNAKQSIKDIEKLLQDQQHLRRISLDYLIDDVLIEQAIQSMDQKQYQDFAIEVRDKRNRVYQEITAKHGYYLDHNSPLRSQDDATIKMVKDILAIFLRSQRFEDYLRSSRMKLADWLETQRQQEKDNITIDYELAGIKDRKGLMSFLGQ